MLCDINSEELDLNQHSSRFQSEYHTRLGDPLLIEIGRFELPTDRPYESPALPIELYLCKVTDEIRTRTETTTTFRASITLQPQRMRRKSNPQGF